MVMAACAHASTPPVTTPSQETPAPSSSAAPAISVAPADPDTPYQPEAQDGEPGARSATSTPQRPPQSDPIPPPAPRCPNVGPLVKTSAVVKREPPIGSRAPTPRDVLDIELTVTLPTNPTEVTFAPNALTVYGGVLVERTRKLVDPTKAVVLIRPSGTVAREGSLRALFGVRCKAGEGNLRVDMMFASPIREGDRVTLGGVDGY
jgi:hypothetical protein